MRTDDGSHTLVEVASGDTFHSGCGAAAECRHVYLENSGIGERLRQGRRAAVLEIGFGTGMAFAITAAEAIRSGAKLEYVAIERRPLDAPLLEQVLTPADDPQPEYAEVRRRLLEQMREVSPQSGSTHQFEFAATCRLRLEVCDAVDWRPRREAHFDAIYFDPFSPASNPKLWESPVLGRMRDALKVGGRLVSYCVSSRVRRTLELEGFQVRRLPGPPGGKREVLLAEKKRAGKKWDGRKKGTGVIMPEKKRGRG